MERTMSNDKKTYSVELNHTHCDNLSGQHTFKCYRDNDGTWYADAPSFGCSKNYRMPEIAIAQMVAAHGCQLIKIIEISSH